MEGLASCRTPALLFLSPVVPSSLTKDRYACQNDDPNILMMLWASQAVTATAMSANTTNLVIVPGKMRLT
jgi:hypothetical protein